MWEVIDYISSKTKQLTYSLSTRCQKYKPRGLTEHTRFHKAVKHSFILEDDFMLIFILICHTHRFVRLAPCDSVCTRVYVCGCVCAREREDSAAATMET